MGRGGEGRGGEGKEGRERRAGEKGRGRSSPNVRDALTPLNSVKLLKRFIT